MIIFGYDPGGNERGGVAMLEADANKVIKCRTALMNSVSEAVTWFEEQAMGEVPTAIGVDAPLYWSPGASGWRASDNWLRKQPLSPNSVVSTNSAYGAMVVQGPLLILILRRLWPSLKVNETHPKVAYAALSGLKYQFDDRMKQWLSERLLPGAPTANDLQESDQWDALFSAWATLEGIRGHWNRDLTGFEDANVVYPFGPVTYYWPNA